MAEFVEDFNAFNKKAHIIEASKLAEDNKKIKNLMRAAREAKEKAQQAKDKQAELLVQNKNDEAEIEQLRHKAYKAEAEMKSAQAHILKMGKKLEEDE